MKTGKSPVSIAMTSLRRSFVAIAFFSLVLNLLMLAGPLYMLHVYDRVLTSQNMNTLIALSVILAGAFVIIGSLDFARQRILSRLGARFELLVCVPVMKAVMRRKVNGSSKPGDNTIVDLNAYRDFLSGSTLLAFFDAPWVPIYVAVLFLLHPYLGLFGLGGIIVLSILAMINSSSSNKPMAEAAGSRQRSDGLFETCERNADLIRAMGMSNDLARRFSFLQIDKSRLKTIVTDRIATFSIISKTFRLALQSGILGVGAALAITGQTSAGAMIAATIILSRAMAPIDQVIGQWRTFLAATASYRKIKDLTLEFPEERKQPQFLDAQNSLEVLIRQAAPPRAQNATLTGISFKLEAGDVVAVIGQSGSGKSTLARLLTGIWLPQRGDVLFDGVPTSKWDKDDLGRQIGYLPQDVELFEGTVRENIARFAVDRDDAKVLEAARAADIHEMVYQLPDGYETEIGKDGVFLSGGQKQRIALARALYDNPFVLVLDEPNSNLDATGDSALRRAVLQAKDRGAIVIVMTHRPSTLEAVNKVLILSDGYQSAFGDKEEVLRDTTQNVITTKKIPTLGQIQPRDGQDQRSA